MSELHDRDVAPPTIQVASSGACWELLIAAPFGVLVVVGALGGIWLHASVFSMVIATGALVLGGVVLVSCAYSAWGTCSVAFDAGVYVIVHKLWRWRWTWRFRASHVRSVFLYDPPPAFALWPGSSGLHIRVSLDSLERSVPIASGLHAPREILDRIQAMLQQPT